MQQPNRHDVLQAAAPLTTATSVGAANPSLAPAQGISGVRPSSLAQIDATLRTATDAKAVPGVVAMAAADKEILYEGAFGTRDLSKGPAMTRDTVFRIASMTKAITSVAAMQLVEQGKLKLDERVPDIDPALTGPTGVGRI
jgi:CubicO group peptidase (beta-lactamase class C family)